MHDHDYAVIMAGGSGTRLWPMSRQDLPKQMQKFVTDKTLLNETVERLLGFMPSSRIYISTTANYADKIKSLVPEVPNENIIIEPLARGTAAALSLVTKTIHTRDANAAIFYLASDHAVTDVAQFQQKLHDSFTYVSEHPQTIVLVGIKPTRPDTGLGYIKKDKQILTDPEVYSVEKFVEKPSYKVAKQYVESGDYYWSAAYYCFRADTLLAAYHDADPDLIPAIETYIKTEQTNDYLAVPVQVHEIEIIDTSKYPMALIPADFGWSDIGNWQSLYELLSNLEGTPVVSRASKHVDIGSTNCLVFSNGNKLVATLGLDDIAVVDTPDALLVLNKKKPQEIKTLLEAIKENGMQQYL